MIDEYEEIIPAVALKQLNLNVNPRSTIMSYFGLFSYVAYLIHKATGNRLNDFSANGRYKCNTCGGLGYTKRVDEELVIDINASIEEVPFKCWRNTNKGGNRYDYRNCQQTC